MTELYNDSSNRVFKIRLNVEGIENTELQVRMILNFNKHNRSYIFYAEAEEDIYSITVPPMSEVNHDNGNMHIEVIAGDTIFKPWEDNFIVKNKKNVELVDVNADDTDVNKPKLNFELFNSAEETDETEEQIKEEPKVEIKKEETEEEIKPFNISTMPKKDLKENKISNFKTFDQF